MSAQPALADDLLIERFEHDEWWVDEVVGDGQGWIDYRLSENGGTDDLRGKIVEAYRADGLGVTIPPSARRGQGAHYLLPLGTTEAWFRYHINLDKWAATDSGKLPGFADVGTLTAKGCNPSTTADPGWSARVLFHPPGTAGSTGSDLRLGYYVYHLDQPGSCGEFMPWNDGGIVHQDQWYCIQGHVRMNTPGENDGVLQAWVDGKRVFSRTDLAFRRATEGAGSSKPVMLRSFWLDVFFGGSTITNLVNLKLRFDELVIRDSARPTCLTRFIDDDDSIHEPDIEWLFDRKLLFGCAQNLVCPDELLTRAELLALIDRYVKPPGTTEDFFTDDEGHWAEGVLNRLAAQGVIKGCAPGRVCPDTSVQRGEIAAFLRRTFDLPFVGDDFFVDDDDNLFEADINAIAAAGVTKGCGPDTFCPTAKSPRDQSASLFARAVRWYEGQ